MERILKKSELFHGLNDSQRSRLLEIAKREQIAEGDYLFLLGQTADRLFVVLKGALQVCLPLSFHGVMQDVSVGSLDAGKALGWSAFVKPYRFTRSARASQQSEVVAFSRLELQQAFAEDPQLNLTFVEKLAEVVGQRLLATQALWLRELQRSMNEQTNSETIS